MASKWHGKQCPMCFTGVLRDGVRKQMVNYRGHIYKHSARGAFCNRCDDGIAAHDPHEEKAWAAFRDRVDAEDAKNLANVRRKLKLTQKQAAEITGGGPNAFSRYDRGTAKPLAAVINLFRLLEKHPELLDELKSAR